MEFTKAELQEIVQRYSEHIDGGLDERYHSMFARFAGWLLSQKLKQGKPEAVQQKASKAPTNYTHFAQRLAERYGLAISVEEYMQLSERHFKLKKQKLDGVQVIEINFKSKRVRAATRVNDQLSRVFLTALPPKKDGTIKTP